MPIQNVADGAGMTVFSPGGFVMAAWVFFVELIPMGLYHRDLVQIAAEKTVNHRLNLLGLIHTEKSALWWHEVALQSFCRSP